MSNENIKKEFGKGSKQAVAVCHSQWRKKKEMMEGNKIENFDLIYSTPIKIIESRSIKEGVEPEFQIEGVAINAITTDNDHKFIAEELESAASSLSNVPLLKDHDNSVDSIMGRVTSAGYDVDEQNIKFKAVIKDEKIKTLIKDGRLNTVSVGASIESMDEEDDGVLVPRGIKFKELSLVAVPADDGAQFNTFRGSNFNMAIQEAYKKKLDEYKIENSNSSDVVADINTVKKEEKDMEKDKISEAVSTEETSKVQEDTKLKDELDKLQEKSDAQAKLLGDALSKIDELSKTIVKQADTDEEPKEEVKEEEPKEEPAKVEEPVSEEPKEEESEEDEEEDEDEEKTAEEKDNYKVMREGYRSFTVVRNKY